MSNVLSYIDLFGHTPSFDIKNSSKFNTKFGGILTILVSALIVYVIWYFGNEMIFKKKPYLITSNYNDADPMRINLTEENFVVALGLQDPNSVPYIDESIYKLEVQHIVEYRYENSTSKKIINYVDMVKCNEKNFTLLPDYFKRLDLKNLYCIKNTDLYIQGDFGRGIWANLRFFFKRCKNSTDSVLPCKSPEEVAKKLDGGFFGMFVTDTTIDSTDINNPGKKFGRNIFTSFSVRAYRYFGMFFKSIQVDSDVGWLMEEVSTQFHFAIETYREIWDYRDTTDVFFTYVLRNSNLREVFARSYLKLQILAANIGGIIKFLLICGELVSFYFTKLRYKEYITSVFFNTILTPEGGSVLESNKFLEKSLGNVTIYNNLSLNKIQPNEPNNRSSRKRILIKKLSAFEIFRVGLCCSNDTIRGKRKALSEAYSKIEVYFDWVHLIKMLMEIEVIKSYTFDENQMKMLSCSKNYKENNIEKALFNCRYELENLPEEVKIEINDAQKAIKSHSDKDDYRRFLEILQQS